MQQSEYINFTHNAVNYHALDTLNRQDEIIKQVEKKLRYKERRYTGLTNQQVGNDLIDEQSEWYKNHVVNNDIKILTFFSSGDKAAKYEIKVLEKLGCFMYASVSLNQSTRLDIMRNNAIKAGFTFNYIDVSEYKL